LTISLWLYNIGPRLSFWYSFVVLPKLGVLARQHPSLWEECILLWKFFPHCHKIQSQQIFPCNDVYPWIMIDLLEEMHPKEYVREDCTICPKDVPVSCVSFGLDLPVEVLGHFAYDGVLSVYLALHSPETLMIILLRLIFV
jgi:hypothetical protein